MTQPVRESQRQLPYRSLAQPLGDCVQRRCTGSACGTDSVTCPASRNRNVTGVRVQTGPQNVADDEDDLQLAGPLRLLEELVLDRALGEGGLPPAAPAMGAVPAGDD